MTHKLTFVVLALVPILASSQPPSRQPPTPEQMAELQKRWQSHVIAVKGSQTPERIPYSVVMESVFGRFATELRSKNESEFQQTLRARFSGSESDLQRMTELAAQNEGFVASVYNKEARKLDGACSDLLNADAQPIGALRVAQQFEQIKAERTEELESHYRAAIDSLSPSTRSALISYAETEVRQSMTWSTIDNIGLATDIPDAFISNRTASCRSWLKRSSSEKTWSTQEVPMLALPADR